jgi:PPOX class probable F420-dependent enzyme
MARIRISQAMRKRLAEARVARLATVNSRGQPHVVPICFVVDGAVFYTAIDRKPKRVAAGKLTRVRNIETTGKAALLIDEYSENWNRLWFMLVRGRARLVTTAAERVRAIRMLRKKYRQYAGGMLSDEAIVIRIEPRTFTEWEAV